MHYSTEIKKNLNRRTFVIKQAGVSSLLFIVLVGLSLTVLTVGYMSSMRSLQSSATTTHAQTQAQMQAMIGYQALTKYLKNQPLTNIDKITTGNISGGTSLITFKKITCGTNPYCFDLIGKSGGASAILRASYEITDKLGKTTVTGSVFAGGLQVNNKDTISGDGVTITVKDQKIIDNSGNIINADLKGITVKLYSPTSFIDASALKLHANYIFSKEGCEKRNLLKTGSELPLTAESFTCTNFDGVSISGDEWTVDTSKNVPVGVLWFKEKVKVKITSTPLINSIMSETAVEATIPTGNTKQSYYAYAPLPYKKLHTDAVIAKICGVSPAIPSQYCKADGTLKDDADLTEFPANIGNILFLTNGLIQLDSGNLGENGKKEDANAVHFFGNIIASKGAGGPGMASAKFVGTGIINIQGNIVVTGGTDVTQMNGNIKVKLLGANDASSAIPEHMKVFNVGGIRYM
ncbi:hypothetical protein HLH17_09410 [Acinetobacter sp. ANC 5380]|uniref:Uncharacterized protein n=1 Tax=Acinetobacter terrae TaxID=2731247 RepID=A0A7Y2RFR3_9GAMM|nr:hypothetical protein [Acinetobacter terrae]NNH77873.1 hypothetical protein [Acinetobacter terrae]